MFPTLVPCHLVRFALVIVFHALQDPSDSRVCTRLVRAGALHGHSCRGSGALARGASHTPSWGHDGMEITSSPCGRAMMGRWPSSKFPALEWVRVQHRIETASSSARASAAWCVPSSGRASSHRIEAVPRRGWRSPLATAEVPSTGRAVAAGDDGRR